MEEFYVDGIFFLGENIGEYLEKEVSRLQSKNSMLLVPFFICHIMFLALGPAAYLWIFPEGQSVASWDVG